MRNGMMNQTVNHKKRNIGTVLLLFLLVSATALLLLGTFSYASWVEEEDGMKYIQDDGQYAVGFLNIENERYYFDTDGHLVTGKFYVEEEEAYYYSDESGILQYGVIQTDEDFYIADENGHLMTGFVQQDGKRYFFNEIAQLVIGWFKQDDSWYYADSSGVIMTGFITVDGYRYYLNPDGSRVSEAVYEIDGITYIFNADGSVDENATALYPVFEYLNQRRQQNDCTELAMNSKVQACAILRASELVDGFLEESTISLEALLANRGVQCLGGYEFSYGGMEDYDMDQLMEDMQKDINMTQILASGTITDVGLGVHIQDGKSYYDIIFIEGR